MQWPVTGACATLEDVRARSAAFGAARGRGPAYTPRNLMLALVGEVGELAECFQWKGDGGPSGPPAVAATGGSASASPGGTDGASDGVTDAAAAATALLPAGGGSRLGPDWSTEEITHLGEELSDVLMYTIKLADACGVDLPAVVARKMRLNELKYPVGAGEGGGTARP